MSQDVRPLRKRAFAGPNQRRAREQRSERRTPASEMISLQYHDLTPVVINGRLVDVSPLGFRVEHSSRTLRPGQVVRFAYADRQGEAQAVWTRQIAEVLQSGFVVLQQDQRHEGLLRLDP